MMAMMMTYNSEMIIRMMILKKPAIMINEDDDSSGNDDCYVDDDDNNDNDDDDDDDSLITIKSQFASRHTSPASLNHQAFCKLHVFVPHLSGSCDTDKQNLKEARRILGPL